MLKYVRFIGFCFLYSCGNPQSINYNSVKIVTKVDTINISNQIELTHELKLSILVPGLFHKGELDPNLKNHSWKGLFISKNKAYVTDTKLTITQGFDDMMDEPGKQTGIIVKCDKADSCVLLMSGIDFKNRIVPTVIPTETQLLPGKEIHFNYLNKAYKLFATGNKRIADPTNKDYDVTNYKLFIEATAKGHHFKQLIVNMPVYEGPFHMRILYVGDIDGDGIPDMIIDASSYYGSTNQTLYLSKPAGNKILLINIGEFTSTA